VAGTVTKCLLTGGYSLPGLFVSGSPTVVKVNHRMAKAMTFFSPNEHAFYIWYSG